MSDHSSEGTNGRGEEQPEPEHRPAPSKPWEIALYAPIGLLFDGPAAVTQLARKGRTQVRNARFVGEIVVRQGGQQLQSWIDNRTNGEGGDAQASGGPMEETVESPPPPFPAADELAIPNYEDLPAVEIVRRLPDLSMTELEAVRAVEAAHRSRKTILNKVAQLQS